MRLRPPGGGVDARPRGRSSADPVNVVPTAKFCTRGHRLSSTSDQDNLAEDDRDSADRLISVRAVLDLEVHMRRQGVPRVADSADALPAPHTFALQVPRTVHIARDLLVRPREGPGMIGW
jgi:hypothetical protein